MVAPHRPHNSPIKANGGDVRFWGKPGKPWPPEVRAGQTKTTHRVHRIARRSWLGSVGTHLIMGFLLLCLPRPALVPVAPPPPKPVQVIEVEFVEIPTANPNKTAAAPPPSQNARTKAPEAPVKPVTKPKPVAKAPRPQTAPRVATRPKPRVARPARRPPVPPAQRMPSQQELAQLAAARLKGRDSDVSDRLAALREGINPTKDDASAQVPQLGTPSVTKALPQGELSGRGVLRAPTPDYPTEAQRKVWEGTSQIMVYVNPDGSVREATVIGSSGFPSLDAAAKRAASGYRFSPLPEGENHLERGVIPFSFVIR